MHMLNKNSMSSGRKAVDVCPCFSLMDLEKLRLVFFTLRDPVSEFHKEHLSSPIRHYRRVKKSILVVTKECFLWCLDSWMCFKCHSALTVSESLGRGTPCLHFLAKCPALHPDSFQQCSQEEWKGENEKGKERECRRKKRRNRPGEKRWMGAVIWTR